MSSREEQIRDLLIADATLMAILTGGIYTSEEIGVEGIRRGDEDTESTDYSITAVAFDEHGVLKPCAVVRQEDVNPYPLTRSQANKIAGVTQLVNIFYYQFRRHDMIDAAVTRVYELLEGERIPDAYPLIWENETGYFPDVGPVANATTQRQTWRVVSVRKAVGA